MKKIIILIAILFATITINAQDYNRWAISGEFGNQKVADESAIQDNEFYHIGLGVRYNINDIVGLGVTGGFDKTSLVEEVIYDGVSYYDQPYDLQYTRVNLEGYLNAFKAVDLYSKRWTLLFHGGPGASFIKSNGFRDRDEASFNHKETVLNLRGGASLLYKVSKGIAVYGDFSTTSNVKQERKFDGSGPTSTAGMSSNLSNISVGLIFYLGKKDKDGNRKEHADWYVAEPIKPVVTNVTTINEYPTTTVTKIVKGDCECNTEPVSEYVFFDHDKDVIKDTELNAIYKAFALLKKNPSYKLSILGFASPTSSSSDYNQKLSERRTNTLKTKLVLMGLDESRITTGSFGKDVKRDDEKVHDVARRVELLITRK